MSGFTPKRLRIHTGTHFLSYPLYSPRSKLPLQNLVQRLKDDEITLNCPQKAFRKPKSFHLRILNFDFKTQQTVEAASEFLRNLDINRMLENAQTAATAADLSVQNEAATNVTIEEDGHKVRLPPLSVSLVGLSAIRENFCIEEKLNHANFIPIDSTNRLHFLSNQIVQRFVSSGIENLRNFEGLSPSFQVINVQKSRYYRRIQDDDGARTSRLVNSYDTRGLIEKYKDVVLAESIPLEKLSLCKIGRIATHKGNRNQELVDEDYEEIESIPLPQ